MANLRNAENLALNSKKEILFNCDKCNKEVVQTYRNYCTQPGEFKLCRSCRNKESAKSQTKLKSDTAKRNWANKEYREKTSEALSQALKLAWSKRSNRTPTNKSTFNDILQYKTRLEALGFFIVTTEEEWNNSNMINLLCRNGHISSVSFSRLKTIKTCKICKNIAKHKKIIEKVTHVDGRNLLHYSEAKNYFDKSAYALLTPEHEWKGKRSILELKCKCCGETFKYTDWGRLRLVKNKRKPEYFSICKCWNVEKYKEEIKHRKTEKNISMPNRKEYYTQIAKKRHETMKRNCTYSSVSAIEIELFERIKQKYTDVVGLYNKHIDKRYDNHEIDFYIPSLDLFIEFQGHWTHYKEPFNANNLEHLKHKEYWESKNSKYYDNAIYTWRDLDVRKRKLGKALNWIEFWNKKEVLEWLKIS